MKKQLVFNRPVWIFLLFLASREYNELLIRSSDGLPPNPRWAENNPEYHHPAGRENEGNLHTNELKWARTIALPESLSPYYPLAEDKILYAYERVAGGLSSPEEALKLANDSIAYSIRKTTSDVASLHERYRQDCLTIGSQVQVIRGKETRPGRAVAVDDQFALVVEWEDGSREAVSSGEVSVRGLLGYL